MFGAVTFLIMLAREDVAASFPEMSFPNNSAEFATRLLVNTAETFGSRTIDIYSPEHETSSELLKRIHGEGTSAVRLGTRNGTRFKSFGLPVVVLADGNEMWRLPSEWLRYPVVVGLVAGETGPLLAGWRLLTSENALLLLTLQSSSGALLVPPWNEFCSPGPGGGCAPIRFDPDNYTGVDFVLRKKTGSMGGRPLRITMFERKFTAERDPEGRLSGSDGEFLNLLAEVMGFNPNFTERFGGEQFGFKAENGTFFGSLGDLAYHRADIAVNGFFLKDYGSEEIVFTIGIGSDRLCAVVPASLPIPDWKAVFLCFEKNLWISIAVAYSLVSVVWYGIKLVTEGKNFDLAEPVVSVYQILLLVSLSKVPENAPERMLVLSILLSSFLIATCFQGSLLTLLSRQTYEREIRTLEDLARSKLVVTTRSKNLLDTFDGAESETTRALRKKLKVKPELKGDMLKLISEKRDMGSLARESEIKYRIMKNYTVAGRGTAHVVEECPRSYHLCYAMPRGTLLSERLNDLLGRILAAGLTHGPKIHSTSTPRATSATDAAVPHPFTVNNLKVAFGLLVIGLLSGLVVFLIELLMKARKSRSFQVAVAYG